MTNTPPLATQRPSTSVSPFADLVAAIESGETVLVGEWTISNGQPIFSSDGHHFAATVQSDRFGGGKPFESAISIAPASTENLLGLQVDLTVEVMGKMQSTFTGLGFDMAQQRVLAR